MTRRLALLAALLLALAAPCARAQAFGVAITIDDLPWSGAMPGRDAPEMLTDWMIEVLRKHRAPVAAFVNCRDDARSRRLVMRWVWAGATIGNHTAGHRDLHATPPAAWARSVRACDASLRKMGVVVHHFRFPALHQGRTRAERDTAAAVLASLGYRNAPVSIDNSDFLLAAPYARAARIGDTVAQQRLGRLMLEHDSAATAHFREIAGVSLGRDVRHVLLLHANQITADHLDELLSMLTRQGARFIALDDALEDPAYRMADRYRGAKGPSWIYRILPDTATVTRVQRWDEEEAERLKREIGELSRPLRPKPKA